MVKVLKYSFSDLLRSRWSYIYFFFFAISSASLLYLSGDLSKAIISLMNIVIILSPLVGTIFGIMYYYNSREFIELLLAQPIRRSSIFLGQYLGLSLSLSVSFVLGLSLPFLIYGIYMSSEVSHFFTLIVTGVLLTFIFTGLAFLIALFNENKIKGFSMAIILWLFMAVIYDGLFLLSLIALEDYPIEKLAIGATFFNPIDLSRILMILQLDISALLGYTGAVFNKFIGSNVGMILSLTVLILWIIIPLYFILFKAKRKDF